MSDNVVNLPLPRRRHVSWTELSTYRQCPHKHYLHYRERWRSDAINKPLAIGILWHEVMDAHYSGIMGEHKKADLEKVLHILTKAGAKDPDHPTHEYAALVAWMYDGYRRHYGDTEPLWKIVQSESEMEFDLVVLKDGYEFTVHGRIDLLVEINRHLWIVDHKSSKNLPKTKELDLDDQMPIYIQGLRDAGYPVRGAIFNNARTFQHKNPVPLDQRFSRDFAYRTDFELAYVMTEVSQDLTNAYNPDMFQPRHPDTQNCRWRCQFVDACIGGRKADHLEVELLKAKGFKKQERNHGS